MILAPDINIQTYLLTYEFYQNFLHSHRPIFTTFGEMTDADKVMKPQRFGSDPASESGLVWKYIFESRITFG